MSREPRTEHVPPHPPAPSPTGGEGQSLGGSAPGTPSPRREGRGWGMGGAIAGFACQPQDSSCGSGVLRRVAVLVCCLLLGSWLSVLPAAQAQSQPPDLPTYAGWLREAYAAAQRGDRLGLEQAAAQLTAATQVRLPDGAPITVDNSWLRAALQGAEPSLPAIGARLGAILDALAQPPSAAPLDARARLAEILANPPFQRAEPSTPSWVRSFFEWLGRMLERLLRPIGRAVSAGGSTAAWVIAVGGTLLLLAVIAYLLRGLRRNLVADAQAEDDPEANLTARTALDQAGGLARGGDYRSAVRFLYLSALLWLDERNVLRYDRALTNREYLERVRENPALRARLAAVVDTFDQVWYGHVPIDAATFARYEEQVAALRSEE